MQLAAAAALVALADALFYRHPLGISLAIFLAALAMASACLNRVRAEPARRWRALALLAAGILPIIEDVSPLSAAIALLATAIFARELSEARSPSWPAHLRAALGMPFIGVFRLLNDLMRANRRGRPGRGFKGLTGAALGWTVPLLLCGVFAVLFVSANPVLEAWLNRVDPLAFLDQLFSGRSIFWAAILCLVWPLVRMRSLRLGKRGRQALPAPAVASDRSVPLGDRTVRRCLVLFNLLFAVQSAMDAAYLWGGVSLPDGLSHASYAHRGAYPLVMTALLAAAFVLIAMRPAGPSERDRLVRPLVIAWVLQNVMLMLSALLRLDLYVAAYSITELRLVAFVWMLLVAAGLVLILVQILSRRTVSWLISANALALALTLYGYSFVDTSVVIANYNLRHSYEMRGEGRHLDLAYLFRLGPSVIPAIDRYAPRILAAGHVSPSSIWGRSADTIVPRRDGLARDHLGSQADWRGWSFRGWRLSRYLANTAHAPLAPRPALPDTSEDR